MVEYIKELIDTIELSKGKRNSELQAKFGSTQPDPRPLLEAFVEELNRLDPRDFEPSARHAFVVIRAMLRQMVRRGITIADLATPAAYARKIAVLLDAYAGEGTGAKTRAFAFVNDQKVRDVVERDYRELSLRTFPDGSWKSTVILAGSIRRFVRDAANQGVDKQAPSAARGRSMRLSLVANG